MRTPVALVLVLGASALAGCLGTDDAPGEPQVRQVEGDVSGHLPTQSDLRVQVQDDDGGTVIVEFDRQEWYVARIVELIEGGEVGRVHLAGVTQGVWSTVQVARAYMPEDLDHLRYDAMRATSEERRAYDLEYEELVRLFQEVHPGAESPLPPGGLVLDGGGP